MQSFGAVAAFVVLTLARHWLGSVVQEALRLEAWADVGLAAGLVLCWSLTVVVEYDDSVASSLGECVC